MVGLADGDGRLTATTVTGTSKAFEKPMRGICTAGMDTGTADMGIAIWGLDMSMAIWTMIGRSGLNP